ncbi:MAG: DUF6494 family protein [Pseudomonadota bacterium]
MSDINETFNMSLRSFLKQVGVTSQKAVEDWVREIANQVARSR